MTFKVKTLWVPHKVGQGGEIVSLGTITSSIHFTCACRYMLIAASEEDIR